MNLTQEERARWNEFRRNVGRRDGGIHRPGYTLSAERKEEIYTAYLEAGTVTKAKNRAKTSFEVVQEILREKRETGGFE